MDFKYNPATEKLELVNASHKEFHQLKTYLIREVAGAHYKKKRSGGAWDGKVDYFKSGFIDMGLWKDVYQLCRYVNVPFKILNQHDFPVNRDLNEAHFTAFIDDFFANRILKDKSGPFFPYDHQIDAAYKIYKNRFCTTEIATSGGKSLTLSLLIFYVLKHINPDAKFLLIVPSTTLVTQFYDDVMDYNLGFHNENIDNTLDIRIEEIMGDRPRKHKGDSDPNLYIGTYQSLVNWPKEFFEQFYCVACDEAHTAKSVSVTTIIERTKGHCYMRYGMSGTLPKLESAEHLMITSLFGPKIVNVRADFLIERKIVADLKIRAFILNHNDPEFNEKLSKIRKAGMGDKALILEKKKIHDSDKRLNFLVKCLGNVKQNTLVLFHITDYGKKILEKVKEKFPDRTIHYIDGDVKGKDRNAIKKVMNDPNIINQILIASYGTLSTGVSINAIFNIMFLESFKSEIIVRQSIGRGLRLHIDKVKLNIYDFVDVFVDERDTKHGYPSIQRGQYKARKAIYDEQKFPNDSINLNL